MSPASSARGWSALQLQLCSPLSEVQIGSCLSPALNPSWAPHVTSKSLSVDSRSCGIYLVRGSFPSPISPRPLLVLCAPATRMHTPFFKWIMLPLCRDFTHAPRLGLEYFLFLRVSMLTHSQSLFFSLDVISSKKPSWHMNTGLEAPPTAGKCLLICSPSKLGVSWRQNPLLSLRYPQCLRLRLHSNICLLDRSIDAS